VDTALPPGSARDPAAAAKARERANNILARIKQLQIETYVEAEVGMSKYCPPRHSPHWESSFLEPNDIL